MKKYRLNILRFLSVLLTIITAVFFVLSIYLLLDNKKDSASFFATLTAIPLTILLSLITYIKGISKKNTLIEPKLNDEHFVDRKSEYRQLSELLHQSENRLFYISGQYGMGKSLFVKMVCDNINFSEKKQWKKYYAYYYSHDKRQKIEAGISNKFCRTPNATISEISACLNSFYLSGNCVLFIDNISELERFETEEFAKAFIKCNEHNRIVISLDSNEKEFNISPSKFGTQEIKLLADSYNLMLSDSERNRLSDLSNGYPVYARYNVKAFAKGVNILDYYELEEYIEKLIFSLTLLEKETLTLVICMTNLLQDGIKEQIIKGIDHRITNPILKKLNTFSLLRIHKNMIYTDKLIAQKCIEFLSEYKSSSYKKIYMYYKNLCGYEYVSLIAALKSDIEFDFDFLIDEMHKQYQKNNFYLLIALGRLEKSERVNPIIRESKEGLFYLRYYYLKSLLELGLYQEARKIVDFYNYQYQKPFSINEVSNTSEFEYQYMLIDLDHLTNYFEDACTYLNILCEKAFTSEQKAQCQYLYAHCLRHMGTDLDSACEIFECLANDTSYSNDKIRLRSIYSAVSIKIFQNNQFHNYSDSFHRIEQIIYSDFKNETWRPYVNRHKAIYKYKIEKNFEEAKKILLNTISLLEVTSLRIKYDIYFELGEIFRISDIKPDNYNASLNYYQEASEFSRRSGDYNLFSNSEMGIMLLNLKYNIAISEDTIYNIMVKSKKLKLNINYNSALFVEYLIKDEEIPSELSSYWKHMQYSDLFSLSTENKSEQYNLKLTVM